MARLRHSFFQTRWMQSVELTAKFPKRVHPIKPSQDEGLARQVHVSIITSDERRNLLPETKETMCSLWPSEGIRRPQDTFQTNS